MSYFEDQYDAWMDNDCRGSIEDTDPFDVPTPPSTEDEEKDRSNKEG